MENKYIIDQLNSLEENDAEKRSHKNLETLEMKLNKQLSPTHNIVITKGREDTDL